MQRVRPTLSYVLIIVMLAIIALSGGASREDSLAQTVVRTLPPVLLLGIMFTGQVREWRSLRVPLALFVAGAMLVFAMLVPLPPDVWTALPGRDLIEPAAPLAGLPQPWRPLAMVPYLGWNAFYALIPPACVLFAMLYLQPEERARLLTPMLCIMLVSALVGFLQIGGGDDGPLRWYAVNSPNAANGFFANRNHHALFLSVGLVLLAAWAVLARREAARGSGVRLLAVAGVAILFLIAVLVTGSRAGLVLAALALVGGLVAYRADAARALAPLGRRTLLIGAGVFTIGLIGIGLLLVYSPQFLVLERLVGLDPTEDMRWKALPTIVQIGRDAFPAGIGFGSFEPVYRAYEPDALLSYQYLNEAHNDYLQVFVEGGIAGTALLALALVWLVWRGAAVLFGRETGGVPAARVLARAAAVGLALVLLASIVDYPVRTPLMMCVVMVLVVWLQLSKVEQTP